MPAVTRKRTAALAAASSQAAEESSPSARADKRSKSTVRDSPAKRQKKSPERSEEVEEVTAVSTQYENKASETTNVVRFDDEGNADKELQVSAPTAPAAAVTDGGSDESDSDEAPEAVSTSRVAKEIMKSAQELKKLAKEQAAASKEKRQQRDALFKKQALERKAAAHDDEKFASAPAPTAAGRKRAERTQIPNVLPAEFLEDSSSDSDGDASRSSDVDAPRRRARTVPSVERRLARQAKGPRDEVIGTTVYRVSKDVDARMAPKVKKSAQSAKDALLRRGRQPVQGKGPGFSKR
ncbi:hypothetical protein E4U17_006622 [Claviceps sp. LM77 group G4]|nr:hypothetical protein E4U17_006622 [Claviceps sp. LM77 group G4]KAG6080053.1 hypothetical protein E4U33_007955 [Claviceps sp. LM78 group G4]KAG6080799.1 hypothetical protein E4U16_008125 [Claviceps sp. LM84 group G4]